MCAYIGKKSHGFQKFCALKINLAMSFIQKIPAGMHWLGYNDAVSWLNEAKRIFQLTANFENFEIYLYFVCQPAVRPGCARCRAPEISHDKGNGGGLRKCCSKDDLPTAPWRFLLSFFLLPCSSLFL